MFSCCHMLSHWNNLIELGIFYQYMFNEVYGLTTLYIFYLVLMILFCVSDSKFENSCCLVVFHFAVELPRPYWLWYFLYHIYTSIPCVTMELLPVLAIS